MRVSFRGGFAVLLILGTIAPAVRAEEKPSPRAAVREDRVVAGGEKDFLEARHLVLQGSNEAIGRALADIGRERHGVRPLTGADPLRVRARRHYIEKNNPILFARMRGAAAAFGGRLDDDSKDFSFLDYAGFSAGCSVIHFPPSVTATGSSLVSRDYDFTTGTFRGTRPRPGEKPCTSQPYVVEMYPDRGYPSLAVYSYDLLSGVLDGVNSEGLTVALLADDELAQKFRMEPAGADGVGLGVQQTLRLLLDTCATTDEAKEALLLTKQFYEAIPVHYLVADRRGQSFVWEYSQSHNKEYIVENPGRPLVTTNFSLHRYLDGGKPPAAKAAEKVCPRYCTLANRLNGGERLTVDSIKETHKLVDAAQPSSPSSSRAPNRTLWHALYFPEQSKVQVSFYLRDAADPDRPGKTRVERSDYLEFALDRSKAK